MPSLTPALVRKQIQAGTPEPIYLILGEDEVEKSGLAAEFAELVERMMEESLGPDVARALLGR